GPAPLRAPEAGGAGAGAGRGAAAPPARRADGRDEHRGEAGHVPLHPRRQRRARRDGGAHRARHGGGGGNRRPHCGPGLRAEDRRRAAGRGARQPRGDRRLPRRSHRGGRAGSEGGGLMAFFVEVLVGGLLAGVMYSLVALGFVLIFKASGVFNFAQGAMVLTSATTYAGLVDMGWSGWAAFLAALGVMIVFALLTERLVLRPLVNQPQISLFMATIGLTFVLEGASQAVWGSVVRGLDLGIPDTPLEVKGVL